MITKLQRTKNTMNKQNMEAPTCWMIPNDNHTAVHKKPKASLQHTGGYNQKLQREHKMINKLQHSKTKTHRSNILEETIKCFNADEFCGILSQEELSTPAPDVFSGIPSQGELDGIPSQGEFDGIPSPNAEPGGRRHLGGRF